MSSDYLEAHANEAEGCDGYEPEAYRPEKHIWYTHYTKNGQISWRGFVDFLGCCRPIRVQAVIFAIFAVLGVLRDFDHDAWFKFTLVVGIGPLTECINTAFEAVLTRNAQSLWIQACEMARNRGERLTDRAQAILRFSMLSHAEQLAHLDRLKLTTPQKFDPGIKRAKDLAAAIVMVAFWLDTTLLTLLLIFPHS